mgnify:CR=1 FL=1
MSIRSIRRQATYPGAYVGTANAAPIYVDSDDSKLKIIPAGSGSTEVALHDSSSVGLTTLNIGAVNGSTVSAVERGDGMIHQTVLTLTATPLTLADATVGAGVKIYDFPVGMITVLSASGSVAETTTSAIATTLNSGVTYNWGVGTTTQASGTLATTEQNIINTTNGTSSTTINVAAAASASTQTVAPLAYNGKSTAIDAFFNVGIATATDIDADATTTWTGTVTITWLLNDNV